MLPFFLLSSAMADRESRNEEEPASVKEVNRSQPDAGRPEMDPRSSPRSSAPGHRSRAGPHSIDSNG
jgi:hypothetical protein